MVKRPLRSTSATSKAAAISLLANSIGNAVAPSTYTFIGKAKCAESAQRQALGPKHKNKQMEIRRQWDPELVELQRLRAEKQVGRISVEDAVALYVDGYAHP